MVRRVLGVGAPCVCGLQNHPGVTYCAACGADLGAGGAAAPPAAVAAARPSSALAAAVPGAVAVGAPATRMPIRAYLGWRSLSGTVIHVGQAGLTRAPVRWLRLAATVVVVVGLGAFLGLVALVFMLSLALVFGDAEFDESNISVRQRVTSGYSFLQITTSAARVIPRCFSFKNTY